MDTKHQVDFDSYIKHIKDDADFVDCPKCGSNDVSHIHHNADVLADECEYFQCDDCGYHWGFE